MRLDESYTVKMRRVYSITKVLKNKSHVMSKGICYDYERLAVKIIMIIVYS